MIGYLYILRAARSGSYYIGATNTPDRRLAQHNANAVAATRGKGPWTMVGLLGFADEVTARRAERHLKAQKSRHSTEAAIAGTFRWPHDLAPLACRQSTPTWIGEVVGSIRQTRPARRA
jgi:predicted GIY-YIG superfamily endonuclease